MRSAQSSTNSFGGEETDHESRAEAMTRQRTPRRFLHSLATLVAVFGLLSLTIGSAFGKSAVAQTVDRVAATEREWTPTMFLAWLFNFDELDEEDEDDEDEEDVDEDEDEDESDDDDDDDESDDDDDDESDDDDDDDDDDEDDDD
jgi:hypothetical protein